MRSEAETKDIEEDQLYGPQRRGDELPESLRDRGGRLERLRRCRERLEQGAAAAAADHAQKLEERAAKEAETGQKLRGRKPKPVSEAPEAEAKANVTDPDSRIMKTRRGYAQGYTAQAVATADQIIVAAEVTADENDVDQLHPMLAAAANELQAAGVEEAIEAALVDAGYCSEANLAGPHPWAPEPPRADGPQAFDEAGTAAVQAAEPDHRAGVRPDQGVSGDRPLHAARSGQLSGGMEGDLRDAQPAEVVAERKSPLELKGRGADR